MGKGTQPSHRLPNCSHVSPRHLQPLPAVLVTDRPGPSNDSRAPSSPLANVKTVLKNPVFWKFFAFVLCLTGVRLIYRHMDATFPKYVLIQS